jgi:hypothetical protein
MREVIKAVKDRQYNDKKKNDRIINIDSPSVARGGYDISCFAQSLFVVYCRSLFLPLLRRFKPAEPVVEKSVIL